MGQLTENPDTSTLKPDPAALRTQVSRRVTALDVAVFVAIVLLGVARLPAPFTGDQALNMLVGKVIAGGGTPYVDLWDLKHPGIFLFFAAGGSLFGFDELGIHLFELLWMLMTAVAIRVVAAGFLQSRVAISLAPLLTVGFYYAAASGVYLTQTEVLVGLPLILSLIAVVNAANTGCRHPRAWLVASGVAAGVVSVFKAPYVLLPGVFWLLTLVELRRTAAQTMTSRLRRLSPVLIGLAIPVTACVLYLVQKGAMGLAWWTFTVHPREAAAETTIVDPRMLIDGTISFVRTFGVLLGLGALGAWTLRRRGWDLVSAALVAWTVGGLVLCWTQVIGWYSYHYALILIPLGLLAARGGETLWTSVAKGQRRALAIAVTVGVLLVSIPTFAAATRSVASFVDARPIPLDDASARRYQAEHDAAYREALEATSFLPRESREPGPIYVFGSPVFYVIVDRPPAISMLATWFHPTTETWDRMVTELEANRPPLVLVEEAGFAFFTEHKPDLADDVRALRSWIADHYEPLATDGRTTWFIREDLSAVP